MPHWINLSFYKDKATASFYAGSFQPRSNALARLVAEATITEPFIDPNHDASDDSKVFGYEFNTNSFLFF